MEIQVNDSNFENWCATLLKTHPTKLQKTLEAQSRDQLISWLCWRDPNGVYSDIDCIKNNLRILTKGKALFYTHRRILRYHRENGYTLLSANENYRCDQ